jgi:hypothetical protein
LFTATAIWTLNNNQPFIPINNIWVTIVIYCNCSRIWIKDQIYFQEWKIKRKWSIIA